MPRTVVLDAIATAITCAAGSPECRSILDGVTTDRVLGMIAAHRGRIDALLARYGARNPQVFGSVARGDASQFSDLDLLVVLDPGGGNPLLRVAGLAEELGELLQMRVDVVADELLRAPVSASAHADAVPL